MPSCDTTRTVEPLAVFTMYMIVDHLDTDQRRPAKLEFISLQRARLWSD